MRWVDLALLAITAAPCLLLVHSSAMERAWRALAFGLLALLADASLWLGLVSFQDQPFVHDANVLLAGVVALFILISIVPVRTPRPKRRLEGLRRFDERDHMFARSNLRRHPDLADRYYEEHPQARQVDERIARMPELGEPGGRYYHPMWTPVAAAAFAMLDRSRHLVAGDVSPSRSPLEPAALTDALVQIGLTYGAVDVGVTALQDHHVYAFRGRHAQGWGQPIEREHTHAVVIVVPMDHTAIGQAPDAPAMVESSRQYVESARIAHLMAHTLRGLGYPARSHVDGAYEVLCVPLAVDAGLGEVGRMGLFMHRVYGPRVRLAVVTTEAPLVMSPQADGGHVEAFCRTCKKCSDNCPSRAISSEGPRESRGFVHWSIDQEACYRTWRAFGSDCALCIRVCPFSKPNTPIHRLARWYVSRNGLNRHIALWADDLLYGRKVKLPAPRRSPE